MLTIPQIKRLKAVNERLKDKIAHLCQKEGVLLDHILHHDIVAVMEENQESIHSNHKEGSFQRLFWDQQMAAAKLSDPRQMRWHPHMIRWCLHLRLISGGGYRLLRESGTLQLPSERTLRDYTHVVPPAIGFQERVAEQLAEQAKLDSLLEWEKFVVLRRAFWGSNAREEGAMKTLLPTSLPTTSSLRILKSTAPAARGNVRGSKHHMEETPLPKRKQPRKN